MKLRFNFDRVARIYDFILPKREPEEFVKSINPGKEDKILEIGAGTGRISKYYANDVKELVMLDPSTKMLDKAKEILPDVKQVVGVVEDLPFEDASFDKVVGYDSFHHWVDQSEGLKEVFRVLKPNGLFVLGEVDPSNFQGKKVVWFEKILRMKSIFHAPQKLMEMTDAVGFSSVKSNYEHIDKKMTYIFQTVKPGKSLDH